MLVTCRYRRRWSPVHGLGSRRWRSPLFTSAVGTLQTLQTLATVATPLALKLSWSKTKLEVHQLVQPLRLMPSTVRTSSPHWRRSPGSRPRWSWMSLTHSQRLVTPSVLRKNVTRQKHKVPQRLYRMILFSCGIYRQSNTRKKHIKFSSMLLKDTVTLVFRLHDFDSLCLFDHV